ncbi:MAG: HAMP domain-containing sensor histidine kinase [Pseudomonadota bacterium]
MLRALPRSLWFRLLAIFVLLAAVFIYGVTLALQYVYRVDSMRDLVSAHLALHVDYVLNDIGDPPRVDRAMGIVERVPVDIRLSGPGVNWASDPRFPELASLRFGDSAFFGDNSGWLAKLRDVEFARTDGHGFLKLQRGDYAIVVSTPKMGDTQRVVDVRIVITIVGLICLLLGYLAVRWLFRPISAIREGAARIGRGNFTHRIKDVRGDELGELAADVNAMASDVQAMLDAKRALLIGISHELRTPLSRLQLASEFVDDDAHRKQLREEVSEMESIIDVLLVAETLNNRHAALNRETVEVNDLLEDLIEQYFKPNRQQIELSIRSQPLEAQIDPRRVLLLMKNLISNALRYGAADGSTVRVTAHEEAGTLVMCVLDNGPGLTERQKQHFGEAFFRNEEARDRESGGTGLGLYLSKTICIAHGGSLSFDPGYQDGACLVVRLPMEEPVAAAA